MHDLESEKSNIGLAFTYNEPVIWFEYIIDLATEIKEKGFKTVLVSNGYVNREPLEELIRAIDAFNIDLKAFSNDFYKKFTGSSIGPVKEALKQIAHSGKHLEVTTLIIPGLSDKYDEIKNLAEWIASELGKDVPLHLSRYYPNFRRNEPPTDSESIIELSDIAKRYLNYVYTGNLHPEPEQNTKCPQCGQIVSKRSGFNTLLMNLDSSGHCTQCNNLIYKYFTF